MDDIKFSDLCQFLPKQLEAAEAVMNHQYTLYGGAAGGGKSYFIRWMAVFLALYYAVKYNIRGGRIGVFCENYPTLQDRQLSRIPYEFPSWLGTLNKSTHEFAIAEEFGGWVITFRNIDDPSKYLSSEFAAILIDELSQNPWDKILFLLTRLRWPNIEDTKFIGATNPGGPAHAQIKKLWIDKDFTETEFDPSKFAFIQAFAADNKFITSSYVSTLRSLPENLRRAYLEGDWDIFRGQFFTEFRRSIHVIEPFTDEKTLQWFRSLPSFAGLDYGYHAQSCILWGKFHDDTLYVYREFYQEGKTYEELREIICQIETPVLTYADPAIWAKKDSPTSGADKLKPIPLKEAMNDRVIGWNILRQALKDQKLKIFSTCHNLIRTLPAMVYDEKHQSKIEDLDTTAEDHAVDALRYLFVTHKKMQKQKTILNYTGNVQNRKPSDLDDLFQKHTPSMRITPTYK